jgi:hypothetical protein
MACNNLGDFSIGTDFVNLCFSALTTTLYGNDLLSGTVIYTDVACTTGTELTSSTFSDGLTKYGTDLTGKIEFIEACDCTQFYCIQNDNIYNDTYQYAGTYDVNSYFTGQTTGFVIYYSSGETRWCLSQTLSNPCDQFGPYGSSSVCPDFDDTVMYGGICITTTTTTSPCENFDFDAIFDCYIPSTPSATPTNTPTPTPTPTPTVSNICGGLSMNVSVINISPSQTPTLSPTPTPTPMLSYSCNFSGEVIFNSINEIIQCANSKKFKDCFTGIDYYTSDLVLVSGTTQAKEGYVYNATINGQGYCVIYDGLFENISGVDSIVLITEIGSSVSGACLDCIPNLTPTPTTTPTMTPTPTPSATPCVLYKYTASNNSPSKVSIRYTDCNGESSQSISPYSSIPVCSTTTPTSNNPQNVTIIQSPFVC